MKLKYFVGSALLTGALLFAACAPVSTSEPVTAPEAEATTAPTEAPAAEASAETPEAETPAESEAAAPAKLNLNTATEEEFLAAIPGLTDEMTEEFEEYRPYVSIEQFRQEIGKYVDEATVAEYEKYVFVPIAVNDADAATLQQIPGVDAAVADALIAARPYDSTDAFLSALADHAPDADAAVVQSYLSE